MVNFWCVVVLNYVLVMEILLELIEEVDCVVVNESEVRVILEVYEIFDELMWVSD